MRRELTSAQDQAIQLELTRRRLRRDETERRARLARGHACDIEQVAFANDVAVRALAGLYVDGKLRNGEYVTTVSVPNRGRNKVVIRIDGDNVTLSSKTLELNDLPDVPAREI